MKKLFAVILAAALLGALASCGDGNTVSQDGEKPTLNVIMSYSTEDVNNHVVAKLLEEKTGYHVNYETLPQDKPMDKLNLLMASEEPYDVVIMSNQKSVFATYAANGALTDLGPLIEKYGKNITDKISRESLDRMKIDGVQYAIPNTSATGVGSSIAVRKDWLDKLDLTMPETVDEFTAMLKAFKEKDPGNNGSGNLPMTLAAGNVYVPNLQGAFGLAVDWQDIDGKLTANITRPEFKKYLEYMRSLYEEGLIDKEFATLKSANVKERFTSGKAGAMIAGYYDMMTLQNTLAKIVPDAEIAYIPLLKGEDGQSGIVCNTSAIDKIVFVPKSSDHPADAVNWINAKLEDDTFREYTIGYEGVHYEVRDGQYYPILPIFYDERNASSIYLTGVDEKMYPQYWQARIRKDEIIYNAWDYINHDSSYTDNLKVSVIESAPYIKSYDDNIQAVTTSIHDFMAEVIAGGGDISSRVDEFVDKWRADKGEAMETDLNEWYQNTK